MIVENRWRASESFMRSCMVRMSYTGIVGSSAWISRTIAPATAAGSDEVRATRYGSSPGGRPIHDDAAVDVEAILLHRADDADDGQRLLRIAPDVLADRILVRPEALRELLVDDDDRLRVRHRVELGKEASLHAAGCPSSGSSRAWRRADRPAAPVPAAA